MIFKGGALKIWRVSVCGKLLYFYFVEGRKEYISESLALAFVKEGQARIQTAETPKGAKAPH